jgi:hypothetical protein
MKRLPLPLAVLLIVLSGLTVSLYAAGTTGQKNKSKDPHQKALIRQAKASLTRLERAIKKDGFYSARAALNVWRSNAIDAGTFDQQRYEDFKKRIYQASIANNRNYFTEYLARDNFYEARICLEIWRLHSEEIGIYDESAYKRLNKQLNEAIRRKQAEDARKKAEAAKKAAAKKPARNKKN